MTAAACWWARSHAARGPRWSPRVTEAMLNTSLGRDADLPVPSLAPPALAPQVPAWSVIKTALTSRPELDAGCAQIARAEADVQVMRDMFRPMATVRTGLSYTMAEGQGWMAMVGLSLPMPAALAGDTRGKVRDHPRRDHMILGTSNVVFLRHCPALSDGLDRVMLRNIPPNAAGSSRTMTSPVP
jgi:hypothetical protein